MYRSFLLIFLFLTHQTVLAAATPSKATIDSCLANRASTPVVRFTALSTTEVYIEPNYRDGYNAKFYIMVNGKNVGYAEKGDQAALLYGDVLYPLLSAKELLSGKHRNEAAGFDPFDAEWSIITDASGKYLCVSFPPSSLGQSGSFQRIRSAYLLTLTASLSRVLYYVIADTRKSGPGAAEP